MSFAGIESFHTDASEIAETKTIAGVEVADVDTPTAIARVETTIMERGLLRLAFLNAHCVNVSRRDHGYRQALSAFLVLPDGIGVDIAAKLLHGLSFRENLNGTDFVPQLLEKLQRPLTVALVGGAPGIGEAAALRLAARSPHHHFVAVSDGFFGEAKREQVLEQLADLDADIVLVAMGVPAQELFISRHLDARHGRVFVGVGALFDFLAGRVRRAPALVRRARLEWAFRLLLEPERLWRRYVLGNPRFLFGVLRDLAANGPAPVETSASERRRRS